MATKITQGDSYWEDFASPTVSTLDTNWVGSWCIVDKLGAAPKSTGSMPKSPDSSKFYLRILPEHTAPLAVGTYIIVVQISNAALGYNKEVAHRNITITTQGLP